MESKSCKVNFGSKAIFPRIILQIHSISSVYQSIQSINHTIFFPIQIDTVSTGLKVIEYMVNLTISIDVG